jgi:type IV secretion system protein VirB9
MGDSMSWSIIPSGSKLFIKPIDKDATTNMTVLTDKRTYLFELYAEEAESIRDENLSFSVYFQYPDGAQGTNPSLMVFDTAASNDDPVNQEKYGQKEIKKLLKEKASSINYNYTMTGAKLIAPIRIFDDGEFTYMQFKNKNAVVPAMYAVSYTGDESIVNYRVNGDYIVVERVESQFTLRNGEYVTCVYNESKPMERPTIYKQNIEMIK